MNENPTRKGETRTGYISLKKAGMSDGGTETKSERQDERKESGEDSEEWAHKRNIRAGPGMDERTALRLHS